MKIVSLEHLPEQGVSHNPEIRKRVVLRRGDVPHVTGFSQATFRPGQVAGAHTHADMYEVFFVEEGRGTITVDGRTFPLEEGVCVVVAPGETHEVVNTGTDDLILTYFGVIDLD